MHTIKQTVRKIIYNVRNITLYMWLLLLSRDLEPYEWYKKIFGNDDIMSPFGSGSGFGDMFREFNNMRHEFERMMEDFGTIEKDAPKELVREYETSDGEK